MGENVCACIREEKDRQWKHCYSSMRGKHWEIISLAKSESEEEVRSVSKKDEEKKNYV